MNSMFKSIEKRIRKLEMKMGINATFSEMGFKGNQSWEYLKEMAWEAATIEIMEGRKGELKAPPVLKFAEKIFKKVKELAYEELVQTTLELEQERKQERERAEEEIKKVIERKMEEEKSTLTNYRLHPQYQEWRRLQNITEERWIRFISPHRTPMGACWDKAFKVGKAA